MVKLNDLSNKEIVETIESFADSRKREYRYASYDYCYNYFREFYEKGTLKKIASPANLHISCHYLGYYLASWGMLRGRSKLLTDYSVVVYESVMDVISQENGMWKVDVDRYNEDNMNQILGFYGRLKEALPKDIAVTDALTTKILMGVFGNVPAFDKFFSESVTPKSLCKKSLENIRQFYEDNKQTIDKYSNKIKTIDIATGQDTRWNYKKAKIIDMIGWEINQE